MPTPSEQVRQCQRAVDAIAFLPNVTTEIVGVWAWAWGSELYRFKTYLESMGWKYAPRKQKWCWYPASVKYDFKQQMAYRDIQDAFGVSLHLERGEEDDN